MVVVGQMVEGRRSERGRGFLEELVLNVRLFDLCIVRTRNAGSEPRVCSELVHHRESVGIRF